MIQIILTALSLPLLTILISGLTFTILCLLDDLKKKESLKLTLFHLYCTIFSALLATIALFHQSALLSNQIIKFLN